MEDPKSRLTTGVSTEELERRWQAAREIMRERKIDYLLTRGDEEFLGCYVRWFTDIPGKQGYPFTVIFPVDDEMTSILSGPAAPGEPLPPAWSARGIKQRLSAPFFPSLHYTNTMDAELAVSVLKEKKDAVIGLVGPSFIPVNFFEHVKNGLPGARFVDATDDIDKIKAIKSPEEQQLILKTAALQDKAVEYLKTVIRPGLREFELHAATQEFVVRHGSEQQLVLISSAPPASAARYQLRRYQNRIIQEGDRVAVLIEVNGPGGYYTEIGRMFCLGQPPQILQDAHAAAIEAQKISLQMLRPGTLPKDIFEANNTYLASKGYHPERRLYAHGQGYDLVESPALRPDEPMTIQTGMNLAVHPFASNQNVWATVCDNYFVTENGASTCLHQTPQELIIL